MLVFIYLIFMDCLILFANFFIEKFEVVCFLKTANFYPLKCIIIADCKSIIQKRNIYANFSVSYFLSCASYKAGSQDLGGDHPDPDIEKRRIRI